MTLVAKNRPFCFLYHNWPRHLLSRICTLRRTPAHFGVALLSTPRRCADTRKASLFR
jgi:hypothetical protein